MASTNLSIMTYTENGTLAFPRRRGIYKVTMENAGSSTVYVDGMPIPATSGDNNPQRVFEADIDAPFDTQMELEFTSNDGLLRVVYQTINNGGE
jgi:hypothetical protein